ncbi:MAG: ion transporter [Alphaproteobacteria bacterium]
MKQRVFDILNPHGESDRLATVVTLFILVLIVLNVIAVVIETVAGVRDNFGDSLYVFEVLSVAIFSAEYLLRLWACTCDARYRHPVWGRLRYAVSFMALVDLLAVLPFFLAFVIPADSRFLRVIRLLRLVRVLKIGHYSDSFTLLGHVLAAKRAELLVAVLAVLIMLVVASCLMFYVENGAQPEAFSSIPAAMWWGMATLTTIGYGDIYPVTNLGRLLGGIIGLLGIGIFALPAGILAGGLSDELAQRRRGPELCPHCGKALDHRATAGSPG